MLPVPAYHPGTYPPSDRFPGFGDRTLLGDALWRHDMANKLHGRKQRTRELLRRKLAEQGLVPAAWGGEDGVGIGDGPMQGALGDPPPQPEVGPSEEYMDAREPSEEHGGEVEHPVGAGAGWHAANRHSIWRNTGSVLGTAATYGAAGVAYTAGALLNVGVGVASGAAGSARELLTPEHYDIHSMERHRSMERAPARRERGGHRSPPRGGGAASPPEVPMPAAEGKAQQAVPPYLLDREEHAPHHRMSMIEKERIRYREQAAMRGEHAFKFGHGR